MRPHNLAADPLWQCLCPTWNQHLAKQAQRPVAHAVRAISYARTNSPRARARHPNRALHQYSPSHRANEVATIESNGTYSVKSQSPIDQKWWTFGLTSLYIGLNDFAAQSKLFESEALCRHLIQERGEKPDIRHFNALILANTNTSYGTIWRVQELLAEMDAEGIEPDISTCHAILRVTAVHLDQFLRADVLSYMRKQWLQLSPQGHHDVAVGLLREGCLELALQRLETMREENIRVESWLLDMFAYALCDAGEIDTAFQIMQTRVENSEQLISRTLWYYLLDAASEARHFKATEYIWEAQVRREFFHVGSGICLNILATAAIAGDAVLATDVLQYMARRKEDPTLIHFQLLIESYMNAAKPDVAAAFGVLSTMSEQRLRPTAYHTRSLFSHLRSSKDLITEAVSTIEKLRAERRHIPIASLNVIISSYIHLNDLDSAVRLYKRLHTFKIQSKALDKPIADVETFNLLFKCCRNQVPPAVETGEFLVAEMAALDIKSDELTVDRLILLFVTAAETKQEGEFSLSQSRKAELLEQAMIFFHHAESASMVLRAGTITVLSKALATNNDTRCWDVLQYAEDRLRKNDRWALVALEVRNGVEKLLGIASQKHDAEQQLAPRSQADYAQAMS